jgi:hypothetical protein
MVWVQEMGMGQEDRAKVMPIIAMLMGMIAGASIAWVIRGAKKG